MKIVKYLIIGALAVFLGFVGWMNMTPGHFQKPTGCKCWAEYTANGCYVGLSNPLPCKHDVVVETVLWMAKLDFNK